MPPAPLIVVRSVSVERIYALRHAVLRGGLPAEAARFEHDDVAAHWAAFAGDRVVGCATVHRANFDEAGFDEGGLDGAGFGGVGAWRLRGMAVEPALRRAGVGRRLLAAAESHVSASGTAAGTGSGAATFALLWCHARLPAVGFYERAGWTAAGDVYDIPTAGPHRKMHRRLDAPAAGPTIAATF